MLLKIVTSLIIFIALSAYGYQCVLSGNDFQTFYEIGIMARNKANIYEAAAGTGMKVYYPPYFSVIMIPFTFLPLYFSAAVWYVLKLICLWLIFDWYRKSFPNTQLKKPEKNIFYQALPFIILINSINAEFKLGQVNLFVFIFAVAAIRFLSRNEEWKGGICFLISCVKATPLIFLPYFIIKRRWSFILKLCVLSLGGWIILSSWFGFRKSVDLIHQWTEISKTEKAEIRHFAGAANQSFSGFFARMFSSVDSLHYFDDEPFSVHIAEWESTRVKSLIYGVSIIFTILVFLVILLYPDRNLFPEVDTSLILILMLLISPDTRDAHMVHLLLPAMLLTKKMLSGEFQNHAKIVLCIMFLTHTLPGKDLVGKTIHHFWRFYSLQTFSMLILLVFIVWVTVRHVKYMNNGASSDSQSET